MFLLSRDFYPRPPRGGRPPAFCGLGSALVFLSTPSARRATRYPDFLPSQQYHFYPRPPRGGRPEPLLPYHGICAISIHALREEGDVSIDKGIDVWAKFLSTPSARRATPSFMTCWSVQENFYPRPPRGGRPIKFTEASSPDQFLSTPSARRATVSPYRGDQQHAISIHALREEGDAASTAGTIGEVTFLSTPSARRATDVLEEMVASVMKFLSTPSARRATLGRRLLLGREADFYPRPPRGGRQKSMYKVACSRKISIHALREEGDSCSVRNCRRPSRFLSTPSARRATYCSRPSFLSCCIFLSTPSARRATWSTVCWPTASPNFYPRPPRGGRPFPAATAISEINFYPRPPRGGRRSPRRSGRQGGANFYPRPPRGGRRSTREPRAAR